ncbi:MAG: hypothetical protein V2A76_01480 [Planctomycetota bacterium]
MLHSLTGLFLLTVLALVVISIYSAPRVRGLFTDISVVRTWLPKAYVTHGSSVYLLEYRVGTVIDVRPHPFRRSESDELLDDWFEVMIAVESPWDEELTDEYAISVDSGMLSGLTETKLLLLLPREELMGPFLPQGEVRRLKDLKPGEVFELPFRPKLTFVGTAESQLERLVQNTLPKLERLLDSSGQLAQTLADPDGHLMHTLSNMERASSQLAYQLEEPGSDLRVLLADLRALARTLGSPEGPLLLALNEVEATVRAVGSGDGLAGALIHDSGLKDRIESLLTRTDSMAGKADQLLGDVSRAAADLARATTALPEMTNHLRAVLSRLDLASRALPGAAQEVRRTIAEALKVLHAIEQLPLINSRVEQPAGSDPLTLPAMTSPPGGNP